MATRRTRSCRGPVLRSLSASMFGSASTPPLAMTIRPLHTRVRPSVSQRAVLFGRRRSYIAAKTGPGEALVGSRQRASPKQRSLASCPILPRVKQKRTFRSHFTTDILGRGRAAATLRFPDLWFNGSPDRQGVTCRNRTMRLRNDSAMWQKSRKPRKSGSAKPRPQRPHQRTQRLLRRPRHQRRPDVTHDLIMPREYARLEVAIVRLNAAAFIFRRGASGSE